MMSALCLLHASLLAAFRHLLRRFPRFLPAPSPPQQRRWLSVIGIFDDAICVVVFLQNLVLII
jgi:hypothetical protein